MSKLIIVIDTGGDPTLEVAAAAKIESNVWVRKVPRVLFIAVPTNHRRTVGGQY